MKGVLISFFKKTDQYLHHENEQKYSESELGKCGGGFLTNTILIKLLHTHLYEEWLDLARDATMYLQKAVVAPLTDVFANYCVTPAVAAQNLFCER